MPPEEQAAETAPETTPTPETTSPDSGSEAGAVAPEEPEGLEDLQVDEDYEAFLSDDEDSLEEGDESPAPAEPSAELAKGEGEPAE